MIVIKDGFTRISAGYDSIEVPAEGVLPASPHFVVERRITGARVVLEFCRATPLPVDQQVIVRYDFAGDGRLREGTGIATPIGGVVQWGQPVLHHYRTSHWIEPSALTHFVTADSSREPRREKLGTDSLGSQVR